MTQPDLTQSGAAASGTAVEALVRSIRGLMRERTLGVGDHLPNERELGEHFSASRKTVREALRTLKAYGLIEVRPKVAAIVINGAVEAEFDLFAFSMDVSRETFADVQAFRRLVEVGVGEQVVMEATADDLARLEAINARHPRRAPPPRPGRLRLPSEPPPRVRRAVHRRGRHQTRNRGTQAVNTTLLGASLLAGLSIPATARAADAPVLGGIVFQQDQYSRGIQLGLQAGAEAR